MDNYGKLVCGKIVFNVLLHVSKFSDRVKLINDKSVTYWQYIGDAKSLNAGNRNRDISIKYSLYFILDRPA